MSLIVNGTEVKQVLYNGVDLSKVIYNGVEVFKKVSVVPYVKFINATTLTTYRNSKYWDGILEWSVDGETWTTWAGGPIATPSGTTTMYLRGTGNTKVTYGAGSGISTIKPRGSKIIIEGDLESLLDYQTALNGGHTTMTGYGMRTLFGGNTNIRSVANLKFPAPSVTFAYNGMFYGCTGLVYGPEQLPSPTASCYSNMFYNCTALKHIPVFEDGATVANSCCSYMYYRCTNVKFSQTQEGNYTKAVTMPSGTATSPFQFMLSSTGGTFTGTPTAGTTYYVDET